MYRVFAQSLAGAGLAGLVVATPVQAQDYSSLFEQRYSSPEDVGVLGRFVSKAVEVGQYDQAISTLEQHLVKYPRDARARYSLAKAYANVGSWELAARNASDALEIGDLGPEDTRDAERLLARAKNSLAGFEWSLDLTTGIKSTWLDTDAANPNSGWRDRQDWNPFIASNGSLRIDLDTPLDDALIMSGGVLFERRYEDINQGNFNPFPDFSPGGTYLHNRGYIAATLDKGIETTALDALRLQISVFGNWKTLNPSVHDAALGTSIRLIIQPTVDMSAYIEGQYGNLFPSENLAADHRFQASAGFTKRLSHEHAVGMSARFIHEMRDDTIMVAEQREVEVNYAGLIPYRPFNGIWTQQVSLAAGDFEARDASSLQFFVPVAAEGRYIKANWTHTFQLDGYNSFDVFYEFKRYDFTKGFFFDNNFNPFDNDYSTHSVGVSYKHTF
jgi:tetratricopeptide (TPR) repeat protein